MTQTLYDWFDSLPNSRKVDIQRFYLEKNKYFYSPEYLGNWYNEDNRFDIIHSLYRNSIWLTDKEREEYFKIIEENGEICI